ncbi:C-type lectin domain family 4 member E-like [Asterias amurensis]|uniref:C-type lectin domain family 4 member E-like n=1 Tax=Asterias amurensis TaxID=7602 RepID=UPI003AB89A1D
MANEEMCFANRRGGPCPPEWSFWRGGCYIVTDAVFVFEEAKQHCQDLGGGVMVPQSWEETNFILDLVPLENHQYLQFLDNTEAGWINCTLSTEWQCFDGGKAVKVWNWDDTQPNGGLFGESCTILQRGLPLSFIEGKWHDAPCSLEVAAICKKPATPTLHV